MVKQTTEGGQPISKSRKKPAVPEEPAGKKSGIDLRKIIVYSEIMKPKFDEEF